MQPEFANDQYYHIYNRGVDKREIFLFRKDYERFLRILNEFNTYRPVNISVMDRVDNIEVAPRTDEEKLVDILCYCLMPNHFHLLIKQISENGITKFMRKIGTGYTMYFNIKNERTGRLFESRFKAKIIDKDSYLTHISRYIHLNPLEIIEPNWKEKGIEDWKRAKEFLKEYQWSTFNNYVNSPEAYSTKKNVLGEIFENKKEYEKFIKEYTQKDLEKINALVLE